MEHIEKLNENDKILYNHYKAMAHYYKGLHNFADYDKFNKLAMEVLERGNKIKAYTCGYGVLELLTEDEPYKYTKGYNDTEVDGVIYAVGECEETGKLIEVREREDKSLFAIMIDA